MHRVNPSTVNVGPEYNIEVCGIEKVAKGSMYPYNHVAGA